MIEYDIDKELIFQVFKDKYFMQMKDHVGENNSKIK